MEKNNVLIDKYQVTQFMHNFSIWSQKDKGLCKVHYSDIKGDLTEEEAAKNAELICTAVNSCKEVNPVNPLAVAENISNVYFAALEAINLFDNYPAIRECVGTWEVLHNAINGCLVGYFGENKLPTKKTSETQ